MIWNTDIDLGSKKFSSRLIVEQALSRGWEVCGFESNPAIFILYPYSGSRPIKIFSASPSDMTYPAAKIAKDKYITNQILAGAGMPVPDEILVTPQTQLTAQQMDDFLFKHKRVVVKPLDASHGNGITTDIKSLKQLQNAIQEASSHSTRKIILIQEQLEGYDIRVLCIGYEYCDAISRIPASVVGDGKHSIKELITLENQSEQRGENYKAKLNRIPIDRAEQYLGKRAMLSVPQCDERVQVIGVSNIGTGGVRLNIGKEIPKFMRDMAVEVAKIMELPVCGIDFMVKNLPEPEDGPGDLNLKIIEINECPMLTMYENLYSQEQTKVVDKYLDYLESNARAG